MLDTANYGLAGGFVYIPSLGFKKSRAARDLPLRSPGPEATISCRAVAVHMRDHLGALQTGGDIEHGISRIALTFRFSQGEWGVI